MPSSMLNILPPVMARRTLPRHTNVSRCEAVPGRHANVEYSSPFRRSVVLGTAAIPKINEEVKDRHTNVYSRAW